MSDARPRLFWFRRDLRLGDNPGLSAAAEGGPVIPVFVLDAQTEALGAAAKWRLGLSIAALRDGLRARGSDLILRRGKAVEVLAALAAETGAGAVHWSRLYAPDTVARDTGVKAALEKAGTVAISHPGHLLCEPWAVSTKEGGYFKVFTPFWKACLQREVGETLGEPKLSPPAVWPGSEDLAEWHLGRAMNRGAAVVAPYQRVGEAAALERLDAFLEGPIGEYARDRDRPDREGTSRLSENLSYGEISPRRIWNASHRAEGGAEAFRRELIWREFAWHLIWHTPRIAHETWRSEWEGFPWRGDTEAAERWRRGMTGEALVDAGMREMFVTGTMHNRVRMVVASYLTKHLLTDWRVGLDWFAECLTDWDPAANALNWQWVAGSGPDAAPYFRVFNPATQAEKFDPEARYRRRFIAGYGGAAPEPEGLAFFEAAPRSWGLSAGADYPAPMVDLAEGRQAALAAYAAHRGGRGAD